MTVPATQHVSNSTTPIVHPKRRRTAPVPLIYAIGVLALAITFSGGVAVGTTIEQPAKQAGDVFERPLAKLAGPAFVKMPEELP